MPNEEAVAPLTLTREDLYELVWSKPTSELAKDFGISDVGLAKRCRGLGIPIPGRGYWARVAAGQTPHRPSLKKREDQYGDREALTPKVAAPELVAEGDSGDASLADEVAAREQVRCQIDALSMADTRAFPHLHPAAQRTAWHLKHTQRSELPLKRSERQGPIVPMAVSELELPRTILLADRLLTAAESLGWTFVVPLPPEPTEPDGYARKEAAPPAAAPEGAVLGELLIMGERVAFRIEERYRDEPRTPTAHELARERREYGYYALRKVAVPTGNLRVVRLDTYRSYGGPTRHTWYDRKGARVEEKLNDVLLGFYELSVSIRLRRAEDERKERERQKAKRLKEEQEARQLAHGRLIKQLEADAGAWHRARFLRRYVQAARKALGAKHLPARFTGKTVSFFDWAEEYINQLDPLHALERSEDFEHYSQGYSAAADRSKESFARLMGSEWEDAWKIGASYVAEPEDWQYRNREKSVFDVSAEGETEDWGE